MKLKLLVAAAAGFSLGLVVAATSGHSGGPETPFPALMPIRAEFLSGPPQEVWPVAVRVGDDYRRLGAPVPKGDPVLLMRYEVNGVESWVTYGVAKPRLTTTVGE